MTRRPVAHTRRYDRLNATCIVQTIERLQQRIADRFGGSGLHGVCSELLEIARQTQDRATWIARPIISLRLALVVLIVGFGIVAVLAANTTWRLIQVRLSNEMKDVTSVVQTVEAGTNEMLILGAGVYSLISLERRIKRRRALAAIHELRSIAHIIDMHQLTKDPESLRSTWITTPSSPVRTLNDFELARYLDYCSEMLSVTGKLAALYVQDFDDSVALNAVNEVEELTTGLSRKIWQKLIILRNWQKSNNRRLEIPS